MLGWHLPQAVNDESISKACTAVSLRYQPFYQNKLRLQGHWNKHRGLVRISTEKNDFQVFEKGADFICMSGAPTTFNDDEVIRLDARDLSSRLFNPIGEVNHTVINDINPPFSLARFNSSTDCLTLVHDGLGYDKLFLYESSDKLVFSNKCWPILNLLGKKAKPDYHAWRLWFAFGWFPRLLTPFADIRVLDRGEIITCRQQGIDYGGSSSLPTWLEDARTLRRDDLLDRASKSFGGVIRSYTGKNDTHSNSRCSADLTGGLDSRAICSEIIRTGVPVRFYTGGTADSPDVKVARQIASRFNLDWHHEPPSMNTRTEPDQEEVAAKFARMLIWDEGCVEPNRFAAMSPVPNSGKLKAYFGGGTSEISKGFYYDANRDPERLLTTIDALNTARSRYVLGAKELLSDEQCVEDELTHAIASATALGLKGYDIADHFYIDERVRRWSSTHSAFNPFDSSVQPFLTVDHIRLAFALSPLERSQKLFQNHIIACNAPALCNIALGYSEPPSEQDYWLVFFRSHPEMLQKVLSCCDTKLANVLDMDKTKCKLSRILDGKDYDTYFLLRLLAFDFWMAEYGA